ncbi:MAG: GNAT family N-acetyltransferase [Caldilineales bacterium]
MQLKVFKDETGFDALRPHWNGLLASSPANTLFLTWEWQSTWWRCLGDGDLYLLAWFDGDRPVGIAPLYLTQDDDGARRFALVGCVDVSDYLDVIAASGWEEAVYGALLDWLHSPAAPAWDVLYLCNLPQDSATHSQLPEIAAGRGLSCVVEVEDVCPVIQLPADYDTYLMDVLSKKQRHEVRRKARRIEEATRVRWYAIDDSSDVQAETDAFIELHRLSTTEKRSFMTPDMQAFFREIVRETHEAGWLYLAFIELNGQRAAAMLGFVYDGRLLVYNSGYDPQSFAELSPGIILTSYIIEDAIDRGLRIFDFLQGDEVYKYRFGASDTLVYAVTIRER